VSIESLKFAFSLQLKPAQKLVLLALADYANKEFLCWPSLATLCKKTSLCRTSVINALKNLCDLKIIERKKRYVNGAKKPNMYCINVELSTSNVRMRDVLGSASNVPSIYDEPSKNLLNNNNNSNNTKHSTDNNNLLFCSADQKKFKEKKEKADKREKNKLYKKYAVEILDLLNEKANKNFQQTESNLELIIARIKEVEQLSDLTTAVTTCRQIVVRKCREWNLASENANWGSKKYLRPKTLFTKRNFSNYQGELIC
jgi:uncharacterized phage protein (TIGR02220 family)